MDWKSFFSEYRWRIIGVLGGIVLTALIFTLGFWRTVLLAAIVALCYLAGRFIDKGGKDGLFEVIAALFAKK